MIHHSYVIVTFLHIIQYINALQCAFFFLDHFIPLSGNYYLFSQKKGSSIHQISLFKNHIVRNYSWI